MTVQMRDLKAKDTFAVIRLAKKLGVTTSIVGLIKQQEKAKDLMAEQKALIAKSIGWQVILEKNPNSKILGLTATPDRMDDKNIVDELFEGKISYELIQIKSL